MFAFVQSPKLLGVACLSFAVMACGVSPKTEPGGAVDLDGSAAKNTLSGTVNLENLGACFGVTVQLQGPAAVVTLTTEAGGSFSAPELSAGAYQLTIQAPGYETYEDVIIFDGQQPLDAGVFEVGVESAIVVGQVGLSDGESPAGTAVSITGEVETFVPDGLNCPEPPSDELAGLFESNSIVGSDGSYQTRVPVRGLGVNARIERPGYTRDVVAIPDADLRAATPAAPINLGTRMLYPLTGFVNVVGGSMQAKANLTLQVSAFNGAGQMAFGIATDVVRGFCDYDDWQTYEAEPEVDILNGQPDGDYRLCVKVRNAQLQEIVLFTDVVLDTTPPNTPTLLVGSGAAYTQSATPTLQIVSLDLVSGLDRMWIYDNGVRIVDTFFNGVYGLNLGAVDGPHTITAVVFDAAGNASLAGSSGLFYVDITNPDVPAITLATGASASNSRNIDVALNFPSGDEVEMQLSESSGFAGAAWVAITSATTFQLALGDGLKTVFTRSRDASGRMSAVAQDSILLDTTGPGLPTIQIDSGATLSNDVNVDLALSNQAGAVQMIIGNDTAFSGKSWQAISPTLSYALPSGDGNKTIYVQYRDAVSNVSAINSASIFLDTTAPGAPQLSINAGAAYATTANLNLSVFSDGASEMQLSENASFAGATWLGYSTSYVYPITTVGQGVKTIYARFRDAAWNIAGPISDVIIYDNDAPTPGAPALTINGGASATNDPVIAVGLSASGASEFQLSEDSGFAGANWQAMVTATSFLLSSGDGSKTVYVRYRDDAGNTTLGSNASISLDRQAPTGISISGPDAVSGGTIDLTLTGSDANGVWVRLSNEPDFSDATWFAFTENTSFTLSGGDGLKTIYAQFKDSGGNLSQVLLHGVNKDTQGPSSVGLAISESPYSQSPIITLFLSATDADQVMLSESPSFASASWESFALSKTFTLQNTPGQRYVYAKYQDTAGNQSSVVSASTILDNASPAAPGVNLNNGDAETNNRTVNVALTFPSGDEVEMQLSENSGFAGAVWVSVAASTTFQLSTGDGAKTLFVRTRDASGRVSSNGQDDINVDTVGPGLPTINIDSGAASSNDNNVDLALGNQAGAVQMIIGEDSAFSGKSWQTISPTTVYTLSAGDGVKTVYVKYRDDVGNEGIVNSDAIVLDTGVPGNPQLSIDGGATYTQDASVLLSLFSDGASEMQLSENASFAGATWQSYSSSYAFSITTGQGNKVIYARFRDAALNVTGPVSDGITYDGLAPAAGSGVSINAGDTYTTSRSVSLALDVPVDAVEIIVANNVGFAGSSWQSVTSQVDWELTSGDGSKTVYAKWRDVAGNETAIQSDSIELDTVAPTLGSPAIVIEAGAAYSNSPTQLQVGLDASGGVAWVEVDDDQEFSTPLLSQAFAASVTVPTVAWDGEYTLYARFRDSAGNWTNTRSDSITIDRTAPTLAAISVNAGLAYTQTQQLNVQLTAYDVNPLVQIQISEDNFISQFDFAYVPSFSHWATVAEGSSTQINLRVVDAAGNISLPLTSQTITLDQTDPAPGVPAITINGGLDYTNDAFAVLAIDYGDASEMRIANNPVFLGSPWEPVTSEVAWLLQSGDGLKSVFVQFRDEAGNDTVSFEDEIYLDTQVPTDVHVYLGMNGFYTNQRKIDVDVQANGGYFYAISTDVGFLNPVTGVMSGGFAATEIVLPEDDGAYAVYGIFTDLAGNQSAIAQDFIVLDRTAPEIYEFAINNGEYYTRDPYVRLSINADDVNPLQFVYADTQSTFTSPNNVWYNFMGSFFFYQPTEGQESRVYIKVEDVAGNQSSVTYETAFVDLTNPTGTIVLDGENITNDRQIAFYFSAISGDVIYYQANQNGVPEPNQWQIYTGYQTFNLQNFQGEQHVYVWLKDWAGNESSAFLLTVTLDTEAPQGANFSINENAVTNATTWSLNLVTGFADSVLVSEDAGFGSALEFGPVTATEYTLLDTSNGTRTLYVKFCDAIGNCSPIQQQSKFLDTQAPVVADLRINNGAAKTGDLFGNVTLNLFAADNDGGSGVVGVRLGNTQAEAEAALPQPYSQFAAWSLAAPIGDGVNIDKYVWAIYNDAANNLATAISAAIEYDRVAPTGTIAFDLAITSDTLAGLSLAYDADVVDMKLSYGQFCAGGSWVSVANQYIWPLSLANGQQFASVQFRDDMGNAGACFSASITVDTEGPVPSLFTVANAAGGSEAGYSNQVTLTVDAASAAGDCAWAELAEDLSFIVATRTIFDCAGLPISDYVLANPVDGFHDLYVRFVDQLGNNGPVSQATMILDRIAPSANLTGGFAIAEGAYAKHPQVTLNLSAIGADVVQIQEADVCGGVYEPFSNTQYFTLSGFDDVKDISVRYRDFAGNQTACFSRQITLDTYIGNFWSVNLTGLEGRSDKTAQLAVTVDVLGNDGDVVEMKLSNLASLGDANWVPFDASQSWILSGGDGAKSVYVALRDRAGNESSNNDSITLDQTPPDPPALQLIDVNGDNFALSNVSVELQWNTPNGTDSYELQRLIIGVDSSFQPIATPSLVTTTYIDTVSEAGRQHQYRIRAIDDIGNSSGFSIVAQAYPFEPITSISWIRNVDQFQFDFPPNTGTFSLLPNYSYENVTGDVESSPLNANVVSWARSTPTMDLFQETLALRTANQDSSLVYDSYFVLPFSERSNTGLSGNQGAYSDMTLDGNGKVHVVHQADGFRAAYATNASGQWVNEYIDTGCCLLWDASIVIDDAGKAHVIYYDSNIAALRYATNSPGPGWALSVIDDGGDGSGGVDVGRSNSLAIASDGTLHASYYDSTNQDLKYAYFSGGVWTFEVVESTNNVGDYNSIAVDAAGKAHISYVLTTGNDIKYAHNVTGTWFSEVVDASGGNDTSIALTLAGSPRIAYQRSCDLVYATKSGTWSVETAYNPGTNCVGRYADLRLDSNDNPHVVHYYQTDQDLLYSRKTGGVWTNSFIDKAGDKGNYSNLDIDVDGKIHITYWESSDQDLYYATYVEPSWRPWYDPALVTGNGGDYNSVAIDPGGVVHVSFQFSCDLYYGKFESSWSVWRVDDLGGNCIGYESSIAVDAAGKAYIVHRDGSNGDLRFNTNQSGSWVTTVVDTGGSDIAYPAIAVDSANFAHVSYYDATNNRPAYATNMPGPGWTREFIGTASGGNYTSIAVAPSGSVHVVHQHLGFQLGYAVKSGGSWTVEVPDPSAIYIWTGSIKLDADEKAHISYYDLSETSLRYATNAGGAWFAEEVDAIAAAGQYNSLTLDANGKPRIAYSRSGTVRYATKEAGFWQHSKIDDSFSFQRLSVGFAPNGYAHILYHDYFNNDLYHAHGRLSGTLSSNNYVQTEPF